MRRRRSLPPTPVNLKDYGNVNLMDMGYDEESSTNPSSRVPAKRGSIFAGFTMGAMTLGEELVVETKRSVPPTSMLRNPSGRMLSEQGVAHQVVCDDVQWKKLQAEMRQKGAVSGMTLKQNLNGLLQDRAKEMPSSKSNPNAVASRRRTSYIADFASSLIMGEGDQPKRRESVQMQTQHVAKKPSPTEDRRRFSLFFTETPTTKGTLADDELASTSKSCEAVAALYYCSDSDFDDGEDDDDENWGKQRINAITTSQQHAMSNPRSLENPR